MLRLSRHPRVAILVLFLLASTTLSGCIGRFALTGKVTEFNLSITEAKWGREVIFVLCYIIPVYPTTSFIDLFIINSIEFWTESNPVTGEASIAQAGEERVITAPDGTRLALTLREDRSLDVESLAPDGSRRRVHLTREAGGAVAARLVAVSPAP
jgi:hypothetical protein